jgi:hypothetical protein
MRNILIVVASVMFFGCGDGDSTPGGGTSSSSSGGSSSGGSTSSSSGGTSSSSSGGSSSSSGGSTSSSGSSGSSSGGSDDGGSSSGGDGGSAVAAWVGTWSCSGNVDVNNGAQMITVPANPATITADGANGIKVTTTSQGNTCILLASVSGSTATFADGQSCQGNGETLTLKSPPPSTAKVSGTSMSVDEAFSAMGLISGTATETLTCTKM